MVRNNLRFENFIMTDTATNPEGRVLFLGTAQDGPSLAPVTFNNYSFIESVFGDPDEGTLVRAAFQAFSAGANEVVLMRISGSSATSILYGVTQDGKVVEALRLRSVFAGAVYNQMKVDILSDRLVFDFMDVRGQESIAYYYAQYPTLGALSDAINHDCEQGKNLIYASASHRTLETRSILLGNDQGVRLAGGQDGLGLTKNDMYLHLEQAYQIISDYPVEFIVPVDAYLDDTFPYPYYGVTPYGENWYANPATQNIGPQPRYGVARYDSNRYADSTERGELDWLTLVDENGNLCSFAEQLIRVCQERVSRGYRGIGIIGMKPARETPDNLRDGDLSHIGKLLNNPTVKYGFRTTKDGSTFENGYALSTVAAEVAVRFGQHYYQDNAAPAYAALLSNLKPEVSSTNKTLKGVELPFEFTPEELSQLERLGYVVFKNSTRRGIVPVAGITMAAKDSGLRHVCSVRTLQGIISEVQSLIDETGIIGEPIRDAVENESLIDIVEKVLRKYRRIGALRDYSYELRPDTLEGIILLDISIRGIYEVSKVSTVVRLNMH